MHSTVKEENATTTPKKKSSARIFVGEAAAPSAVLLMHAEVGKAARRPVIVVGEARMLS